MADCYVVAAVRHFEDGKILHDRNRYDNAMCHYAFAAECCIKEFIQHYNIQTKINKHDVGSDLNKLQEYFELWGFLKPELYPLYGIFPPPDELFSGHPERRYWQDIPYAPQKVMDCRCFVESLMIRKE